MDEITPHKTFQLTSPEPGVWDVVVGLGDGESVRYRLTEGQLNGLAIESVRLAVQRR